MKIYLAGEGHYLSKTNFDKHPQMKDAHYLVSFYKYLLGGVSLARWKWVLKIKEND